MEVVQVTEATTATQAPDTGQSDVDALPSVVTRRDAALKIVEETNCSLQEAFNMINWLEHFVDRSRKSGYTTQFPSTKQMSGRNYELFDEIMPHGQAPTPGTAAHVVNQALLNATDGETYILHDQSNRYDAVHCSVQVQTLAVQLS